MRNLKALALTAVLFIGPVMALAHGQPPTASHGGIVQEAHENWVELLIKGDQVWVYVLDEAQKPVPASQISGTATVMIEGQLYKVEIHPADGNSLEGKLPVSGAGRMFATVSIRVGGQPASARFNLSS